jgi:lipoprotein NlpI
LKLPHQTKLDQLHPTPHHTTPHQEKEDHREKREMTISINAQLKQEVLFPGERLVCLVEVTNSNTRKLTFERGVNNNNNNNIHINKQNIFPQLQI